ncbi:hypothetical protein AAEH96_15440 [Shewanella xiamenensis]|uniref:hypothetical protein n=2 Tax=Shewanella xiamenensis TaxID=332186 RepID=UPI00313A86A5
MKVQHSCPYCMQEQFKSSKSNVILTKMETKILDDSCIHYITCEKNHKYAVVISAAKYELLFDIGLTAFADGYMREAVSSFSASLERFYEFFINFYLYTIKFEDQLVTQAWKSVSNQSERQLGAFNYLYLTCFQEIAPELDSAKRGFRNKVIHKGYIPNPQETIEYSRFIYEQISHVITKIEKKFGWQHIYDYYNQILPIAEDAKWTVSESAKSLAIATRQNNTCVKDFNQILTMFKIHL